MVCCRFEGCIQSDPLSESTPSYSATLAPMRILRPRCMPQGLKNSPAVWWQAIKLVLADVWDVCDPYINDIIIRTQKKEPMSHQDFIVVEV